MPKSYRPVDVNPDWLVGKYALMSVQARVRAGRTEIEPHSWRIPYQWQGYHYQDHDDEPFMLMVNSSGGFVEGDVSRFYGHLEAESRALFTTTASSKYYKCLKGETTQELVDFYVGPDATLEYCPDEAIPFAQSRAERMTRVVMEESSRLFATDMISAGRIHHGKGEAFHFDSLVSEFDIRIDKRPIFTDRLVADTADSVAALPRLWQGYKHMATVVGYAPDLPEGIEAALEGDEGTAEGVKMGVSRLGRLVVARILAEETWQAHEAIFRVWTCLRPAVAGKRARAIRKC
ncbi:MAG: hypothetical protein Kilf2KO_24210 [Rhodospirillales bacterium]